MAEPKKKLSATRSNRRRSQYRVGAAVGYTVCTHCGETIKSHIVCPKCGYFAGQLAKPSKPKVRLDATETPKQDETK